MTRMRLHFPACYVFLVFISCPHFPPPSHPVTSSLHTSSVPLTHLRVIAGHDSAAEVGHVRLLHGRTVGLQKSSRHRHVHGHLPAQDDAAAALLGRHGYREGSRGVEGDHVGQFRPLWQWRGGRGSSRFSSRDVSGMER